MMEPSRLAVFLCVIAIIPFARGQDCPPFDVSLLGSTTMASETGLVGAAYGAAVGEGATVTVQIHSSHIVCLHSGLTRNTYSGVSVVVNQTCTGVTNDGCTGSPILSQFDFGCVSGPRWDATVGGSGLNIITTPSSGSFSTTLRSDCGVCVSPQRSMFESITNNEQHCGSCNTACNVGAMRCTNRLSTGCCSFYEDNMCVASCTSPLVPNSNFDCVHDCPDLTVITNGDVSYQPPGTPRVVGTTASYSCDPGYTLSDTSTRTCQAANNGTWTGSDPICNPVDCGPLTRPTNGMVVLQGTTFGQVATYSCNDGYERVGGDMTRTCLENATWSGSALSCELTCPQCQNGGTCISGTGMCTCPPGFTGNVCSEMLCPPCNAGTCDSTTGMCLCPSGFTGADCSDLVPPDCDPPCVNGNCTNGVCVCPPGYVASDCSEPCSSKVPNCKECREEDDGTTVTCTICLPGYTLDDTSNECKEDTTPEPIVQGGCTVGCIIGIIFGVLLAALLLAAIVAAIVFALYKHLSNPATQLKKGEAEGLNGVAKDNPLYVDPSTVEEEVGASTAATEEA